MKALFIGISIFLLNIISPVTLAIVETHQFSNAEQKQAYDELIFELRCLVCQNQNLADSNAELAQDLRQQVYVMLTEQNANKQEIVNYMVQRYGEFVLYKPPVETHTALLWAGPFLFLMIGVIVLIRMIKRQNHTLSE